MALAEELLEQAEAALSRNEAHDGSLDPKLHRWVSSQMAVLQVVIARVRGDSTQRQQELAMQALERVDPTSEAAARATLYFRLGLCYLDLGKDEQADRTFVRAFELGQASGNHYTVHAANYGRMVIAKLSGRLHDLAAICQQALDEGSGSEENENPLVGIELTMAGILYYEWNQLDQAEGNLKRGLELVEQLGITELLIKGQFALACLQIAARKID